MSNEYVQQQTFEKVLSFAQISAYLKDEKIMMYISLKYYRMKV